MRAVTALSLLFLLAAGAHAQPAGLPDSRIVQVKVYPGSATVERVARVAAGTRVLRFTCLPAQLDAQSLQVQADAPVRIGETTVLTEPRTQSAACSGSGLDSRIRALEDQKAQLQAERDALGLVTGYLKGLGSTDAGGRHAAPDARGLVATAEALRRTGQDALARQHQIARQQDDLERQLQPLRAERARAQGGEQARVVTVSVTLDAPRDAQVRLSYQVAGPSWSPAYRALLDTDRSRLRLERQALVTQATGEDWRGVKLVLSTGQPRRGTRGPVPAPWRVGIEPPPRLLAKEDARRALPLAAPAPAAAAMAPAQADEAPDFSVQVADGSFATEFAVPQAIDLPSGGPRVALALGQHEDEAQLAVRVSPRQEAAGYLVAELAPPAGVWPAGPLQLYRDGAFVGTGQWAPPGDARVTLSFGRDELLRVQVLPEQDSQGSAGFTGGRTERRVQRAYVVENRHRTPVRLQVLEAAPVSVDEQVRVASEFSPRPASLAWNEQPGVALWTLELGAGQSTRLAASHTLSWPKDAQLQTR